MTATPPRPIAPGDIVTGPSDWLGEWTAAQITGLDPDTRTAAVLHLDWSGPEPTTLAELGPLRPLRLTHHSWQDSPHHLNVSWILPRSLRVLGSAPLLGPESTNSFGAGWSLGCQLALQRHWNQGHRTDLVHPWQAQHTAASLPTTVCPEVRSLSVTDITDLDCATLVATFPNLRRLSLHGDLGTLHQASALNSLFRLRKLTIRSLFGMTAGDLLSPQRVPELESLDLGDVPAEYAAAMRRAWVSQAGQGVRVEVRGARKPEWVAENRDNPLRDWDGREGISAAVYRKSIAQYKRTRRAVLAALADPGRLFELGEEFGEAFNRLDEGVEFIETVEREELFAALEHIVGGDATAMAQLADGVDATRDW